MPVLNTSAFPNGSICGVHTVTWKVTVVVLRNQLARTFVCDASTASDQFVWCILGGMDAQSICTLAVLLKEAFQAFCQASNVQYRCMHADQVVAAICTWYLSAMWEWKGQGLLLSREFH